MRRRISLLVSAAAALIGVVAAGGCKKGGLHRLSRLAGVGDSLSAGHQDSCLIATQQVNCFASRVAERAATERPLPPIGEPGAKPSSSGGDSTSSTTDSEFCFLELPTFGAVASGDRTNLVQRGCPVQSKAKARIDSAPWLQALWMTRPRPPPAAPIATGSGRK